jgi:ATP-dependent DNA helicase DinG
MLVTHKEFDKYVKSNFPDFEYRSGQREVVEDIIKSYNLDKNGVYLLDAPTGTGKSLIGILFASFMSSRSKTGYILTSDISLHEQYTRDFNRYNLSTWGQIKGVDNYNCTLNSEKFSIGECKNKGLNYQQAEKLNCYGACGYFQSRKRAIVSPVSLLTYSYALIQRNYVEDKSINGSEFTQRDFVVCDEAHKVVEIVQTHFSPRISNKTYDNVLKLVLGLTDLGFPDVLVPTDQLKDTIYSIYKEEDKAALLTHLKRIMIILGKMQHYRDNTQKKAKEYFGDNQVTTPWKGVFKLFDYVKDVLCKVEDYIEIIEKSGLHFMIKSQRDEEVTFNCLDEKYLMEKHFLNKFGFKLLMTATMGSKEEFQNSLGAKKAFYKKMDSTFDFTKSPVYFYPKRRMSKKDIDANMTWLVKTVVEIMDAHPNDSGVIHSGSYDLGNKLYQRLSMAKRKRIHLYRGTEEKMDKLSDFINTPGNILIGPSLLEGLDLKDDKSRLQIFLKVPYPNLGDKYVSEKMKYSKGWYNWKTCTSILQGVGRSVRSEEDWAITYFLDGCLTDLITRSADNFPDEFLKRIVIKED